MRQEDPPREDQPPWEDYDDGIWRRACPEEGDYTNPKVFVMQGVNWGNANGRRFHRRARPGCIYFRFVRPKNPGAPNLIADEDEPEANVRLRPLPPDAA